MSNRIYSPVIGYASLSSRDNGLAALQEFCQQIPSPIEILAEEIEPTASNRPMWNDTLGLIEKGEVTTLIVPSLTHVAGPDVPNFVLALKFLQAHGVVLKSLSEKLDSRRHSRPELVASLMKSQAERSA